MNASVLAIGVILSVATVLIAVIPIIVGKRQLRRALRPVAYYPPRGFSPIDVLIKYYGFRSNTHALLNPLMLYWADRGFITIEEDCKRGLKLTKLRDLEQPPDSYKNPRLDFNDFATETLVSKDFDAEKKLFDGIFKNGDVFYTLAAKSSQLDLNKEFVKTCAENASTVKTPLAKKISRLSFLFAILSAVVTTIVSAVSAGGGPAFICILFPLIAIIGLRFVPLMANEAPTMVYIMYPFFAVWGGAPFIALTAIAPASASVPIACAVLSSALTVLFLTNRIDIRSEQDLVIYGHIAAFKTFLLEAEADRINTLVEENPNYYYDVLPYCYILKITDTLKAKFDRVALDGPSWYLGDMRNTLMF